MGAAGQAARRIAVEILAEVDRGRVFADDLLPEHTAALSGRDRRLVQEVVCGTIRHRNTLDRILKAHMPGRADPRVRWILRAGAYQLTYLTRVPEHAVVHASTEVAKAAAPRRAGFVNAVLRAVSRAIEAKIPDAAPDDRRAIPIREGFCRFHHPLLPSRRRHPAAFLALRHSHPEWLVHRWLARFGPWTVEALCRANNRTPGIHLRVTARAPSPEEAGRSLEAEGLACETTPQGLALPRGGDIARAEAFRSGWVTVQDRNAIQMGALLRPPPGATVLDLCAAPGGKTAQLAEAVGPAGRIVACDVSEAKLDRLRRTLTRLRLPNADLVAIPAEPARVDLGARFAWILVDAPCSNTGVLARRPEARWRLRPKALHELAALQRNLLEAALRHLSPGGTLVYATCSIEPEENQALLREFLAEHRDLRRLEILSFLGHRDPGDGGFAMKILRAP